MLKITTLSHEEMTTAELNPRVIDVLRTVFFGYENQNVFLFSEQQCMVSVCMDTSTIHRRTTCAVTLVRKGISMCWAIKPMSSNDATAFKLLLEETLDELQSERIFAVHVVSDAGT